MGYIAWSFVTSENYIQMRKAMSMFGEIARFNRVSPLQAALPCSLLFLLSAVISMVAKADVSKLLYTGITHTSNLEVQTGGDITLDNQENLTREGFETGISIIKQKLDYNGGYSLQADASFNKGLSDSNNISNIALAGSRLSVLNPNWLLRTNAGINGYDNQALPINSHTGLFLESTFGYLNQRGGGDDISLSIKREFHDQVDNYNYNMTRSTIGLTHYFNHKKENPYWSLQTTLKNNNANIKQRDYNSLFMGTRFRGWSLGTFKGQVGLSWQQDLYDEVVSLTTAPVLPNASGVLGTGQGNVNLGMGQLGNGMFPIPTNSITPSPQGANSPLLGQAKEINRKDNLYSLSLQLDTSLSPSMGLQFSASVGRYDSTFTTDSDNFYSVAAKLAWKF